MQTTVIDEAADRLDLAGDRLNPLLVREVRQVFKSWWFAGTFLLLLCCAWGVSFWGVWELGDRLEYYEAGPGFFRIYFLVLVLFLFTVVPLGAFNSVCSEFTENTFELLSISGLHPSQIVYGKLQCAVVRMGVYYSAIAPFLCLTYLLGGVGVLFIGIWLLLAFVVAVGLCMFGLMLGSLSMTSFWQNVNVVLLILGCLFVALVFSGIALGSSHPGDGGDLGIVIAGLFCFGVAYLYFFILAQGITITRLSQRTSGERAY